MFLFCFFLNKQELNRPSVAGCLTQDLEIQDVLVGALVSAPRRNGLGEVIISSALVLGIA